MFESLLYTLRDFIPPGVVITTTLANPIIKIISNSTSLCYDNSNEVMLNSVLFVLLVFGSIICTLAASLGMVTKPYFRYNLEGKIEWIYANVLGTLLQICVQIFWILLSREEPLGCWVKMSDVVFVSFPIRWIEMKTVVFLFTGGLLFGVIYLLNKSAMILTDRRRIYEHIR